MLHDIEEFNKRYGMTWVRYRDKAKKYHPAQVFHVDTMSEMISLLTADLGNIEVKFDDKMPIDLDPPETGYFNHNGHGLFLFKTPARQWRRGFCSENHEIFNPFKRILNMGAYRPGFNHSSLLAMYEPEYAPDPDAARQRLSKATHSVALSRHLMISKSPLIANAFPLLWYNTTPCGFVRGDKFVVEDELFQQEVEDELKRIGQAAWIF